MQQTSIHPFHTNTEKILDNEEISLLFKSTITKNNEIIFADLAGSSENKVS